MYALDIEGQLNAFLGDACSVEPALTQAAHFRPHNRSKSLDGLYLAVAGMCLGAGLPGTLPSAEIVNRPSAPRVPLAQRRATLAHSEP